MATLMFIITTIISLGGNPNSPDCHIYPLSTVVVEVDVEEDILTCADFSGNLWDVEGTEDWIEGDKATLLMWNNDTPDSIYDDVCLCVNYDGWIY